MHIAEKKRKEREIQCTLFIKWTTIRLTIHIASHQIKVKVVLWSFQLFYSRAHTQTHNNNNNYNAKMNKTCFNSAFHLSFSRSLSFFIAITLLRLIFFLIVHLVGNTIYTCLWQTPEYNFLLFFINIYTWTQI